MSTANSAWQEEIPIWFLRVEGAGLNIFSSGDGLRLARVIKNMCVKEIVNLPIITTFSRHTDIKSYENSYLSLAMASFTLIRSDK